MTNSRAPALAKITAETDDPPGGTIHRQQGSREPMGVLEESAEDLVNTVVPEWSTDVQIEQMKEAMAHFNRFGITSAISACVSPKDVRVLDTLRRERRSRCVLASCLRRRAGSIRRFRSTNGRRFSLGWVSLPASAITGCSFAR